MDDQPVATPGPAPARPASNIPEYTVGEISGAVKRTLEGAFGRIRVRGEVTEARPYASGHIYFSLKEERCKLACVAWASVVPRLGLMPENGTEVLATGRLTTYGDRSSYQLQVERLEYAGIGALLARVEALRQKLLAEGLFDAGRKRALPLLPRVVGVITSESGAVLQDIRTTVERRFPRRILLWPVPVQGQGAAERIAAAINDVGRLSPEGEPPRPDVLIVARGGGSLEDLQAFNEEVVVRAAAACPVPLISAVGHETDTTLIDYAADFRAPTPTAAAELAVPSRADLLARTQRLGASLLSCAQASVRHHRVDLQRAARGLPDLPTLLGTARQRLDDRDERLRLALPALLARRQQGFALAQAGLGAALRHAVARRAAEAARILPRLSEAPLRARLREVSARLAGLAGQLEALSHRAVLARGYAVVFGPGGEAVTSAVTARGASELRVEFADGPVSVRPLARREDVRQGALF